MTKTEFIFWLEGFISGKNIIDTLDMVILRNKMKDVNVSPEINITGRWLEDRDPSLGVPLPFITNTIGHSHSGSRFVV